jgi:prepilin-type N-terminal cleavage/methylation domain-containing protein
MATADVATPNCRGFTLIELMAGLAILALYSCSACLRSSRSCATARSARRPSRSSTACARRAPRRRALNSRVAFRFTGTGASWEIKAISDPATDTDCTTFAADVIQRFASEEAHSAKVTLTPADKAAVCFTGLGRVWKQGTASDHIQLIDIEPAVAGAEGRKLRIIVDDVGAVDPTKPRGLRMCDPDPALALLTPPDPRAC